MKNKIKVLGIIALAAIIGFGFLACGDPVDEGTEVTIEGATIGLIVGETLTAVVSPDPGNSAKYGWYEKDKPTTSLGTGKTYVPSTVGSYYVVLNPDSDAIKSNEVEVFNIPLGKYIMEGSKNGNFDASNDGADNHYVDITKIKFRLDSSQRVTGKSGADEYEWLVFDILKWKKRATPQAQATTYPIGLELTIDEAKQNNFAGSPFFEGSPKVIYIYAKADMSEFIRSSVGKDNVVARFHEKKDWTGAPWKD